MTNQVKLAIVVLWTVAGLMVGEAVFAGYAAFVAGAVLVSLVIGAVIVIARKNRREAVS